MSLWVPRPPPAGRGLLSSGPRLFSPPCLLGSLGSLPSCVFGAGRGEFLTLTIGPRATRPLPPPPSHRPLPSQPLPLPPVAHLPRVASSPGPDRPRTVPPQRVVDSPQTTLQNGLNPGPMSGRSGQLRGPDGGWIPTLPREPEPLNFSVPRLLPRKTGEDCLERELCFHRHG